MLGDSALADGVLSVQVGSFSYFAPVVVTYPLPLLTIPPLQVTTSLDCGGQDCGAAIGTVTATFTTTTNNGQLPAGCTGGHLLMTVRDGGSTVFEGPVPGLWRGTVPPSRLGNFGGWSFTTRLSCDAGQFGISTSGGVERTLRWRSPPPYPRLGVIRMPVRLDVIDGLDASLDAVLVGGAAQYLGGATGFAPATATDRAVIDWERSDDGGRSWRPVARSYQDEADPNPVGDGFAWRYWGLSHGFIASAADHGALLRVHACYTPPDVPAPPCVNGPATQLNVLQHGTPPTITTQPASLGVVAGSDAAFAVAARGTEVLSYQWRLDGTPIAGATGPVLRLSAVGAASAGGYSVVVSNAAGSAASDTAILTVSTGAPTPVAPTIVTQPAAVVVHAGDTATFAVGVSGSGPLSFAWRKDGAPIAGATSAALTLVGVASSDAGSYSVTVTNGAGTVTSADAALVVGNTPPVMTPPTISTQPATLVVVPGAAATLAVAASGSGPLGYQWSLDGVLVAGATGPVLTISSVGAAEAGSYTVTIVNDAGTVTSNPAQLLLVGAPLIIAQPAAASVIEGSTATFTVAATGAALRYQWARNGLMITGATGPSHTTPATALADSGAVYGVLVYNGAGLVLSQPVVLTVTAVAPTSRAWSPATLIETDNLGDGTRARVAMDASGNAIAVWQQNDNVRPNIWANRYSSTSQSWGVPTLLETGDAGGAFEPQVAMAGNGDAVAVWYQDDGASRNNIWANRYVAATDSWGTATLLEASTATASSPQVAVDVSGDAMVVWSAYAGSASIWAIRYTAGTGWDAAAQRIETGATNSAGAAQIAVGANGDAFAVWTRFDGARNNIWANRYAIATHAWETATPIESGNAGTAEAPHVAVDVNGNAVAAWTYFDGARYDILVNRYGVSSHGWDPVTPSLTATATGGGDAPRVAVDVAGNATVVWAQADAGRYSIWANRLTVGAGWATAVLIETDDAGDAALPQVAVDGTGNAIAVWYQSDGTRNDILSNRFTAGSGWGTAAVLEAGAGTALRPHVAVNASGNATVVWDQYDGSRISIWASSFR